MLRQGWEWGGINDKKTFLYFREGNWRFMSLLIPFGKDR